MLHWRRGTPDTNDAGVFDQKTFWEQIDDGVQWTRTRKLFMILPVLMYVTFSPFKTF